MLRRLAVTLFVLAAGSSPAVAQTATPSHAQMHAMLMSGAPMDSAQCAAVHAALAQHFANLPLDSTQMAALHTMLLARVGVIPVDSTQLAAVHATLQQAMASGALDADHVAMFHAILSDSAHLAVIRSCFGASMGGGAGGSARPAPRRH